MFFLGGPGDSLAFPRESTGNVLVLAGGFVCLCKTHKMCTVGGVKLPLGGTPPPRQKM